MPPVDWGDSPASQTIRQKNDDSTPTVTEETPNAEPVPQADTLKAITPQEELTQWERFTLKRLGQNPEKSRPFKVHVLPTETAFEVSARLLEAGEDSDAVRTIFAEFRDTL
jgi:hypothetical protein